MSYTSSFSGSQIDRAIDKMINGGAADWNAKEGEPGYIENRPFYKYQVAGDTILSCNVPEITGTKSDVILIKSERYSSVPSNFTYFIKGPDYIGDNYTWGDQSDEPVYWDFANNAKCTNTLVFCQMEPIFVKLTAWYEFVPEHEDSDWNWYPDTYNYYMQLECIDNLGYEGWGTMLELCEPSPYYEYSTLSHEYLPDTVLKTTPQTFSEYEKRQLKINLGLIDEYDEYDVVEDTFLKTTPQTLTDDEKTQVKENLGINYNYDTFLKTTPQTLTDDEKTQVKENLGITDNGDNGDNVAIDPVVWKYMCKPFVIGFDDYGTPELDTTTLPDDLLPILNSNFYLGRFLLVARNMEDFEHVIVECIEDEYPYYKFSYGSNKTLRIGFSESGSLFII